jgi:hypothetical protein
MREKVIKREIQFFYSLWNAFAAPMERLLYRNQLIRESKSRNRMPSVNLHSDLPILSVWHRAIKNSEGVAIPSPRWRRPLSHTLGEVWDTQALSHRRASAMRCL